GTQANLDCRGSAPVSRAALRGHLGLGSALAGGLEALAGRLERALARRLERALPGGLDRPLARLRGRALAGLREPGDRALGRGGTLLPLGLRLALRQDERFGVALVFLERTGGRVRDELREDDGDVVASAS